MKFIDDFLNSITMYRLVLYFLIILLAIAFIFSLMGILNYSATALLFSSLFLVAVCYLTNYIFSQVFKVVPNVESVYISALILALVITPNITVTNFFFMFWVGVLTISAKFIIAIYKRHIFNPVAISGVILALTTHQSFSWWVGTKTLLPIVILGGVLIVRKIHRFNMVAAFLATVILMVVGLNLINGKPLLSLFNETLIYSPLFFFATIMLTEPQTSPPTNTGQIVYGVLTGFLFSPQIHIGSLYTTPELALVLSNLFSYGISFKKRLKLKLEEIIQIGTDTYDFIFNTNEKFAYQPGQYLEWTLDVNKPDSRGNRRYFTLASSPTENSVRLGVKFYPEPSRFKQSLSKLETGDEISATTLSGSFTLPKNPNQKCVFIAGGIGITPFRSMLKYLIDTNQKRDIVLFYSNKTFAEIAYTDIFNQAQKQLGIRTIHTLTNTNQVPANWPGKTGYVDQKMLLVEVPDYKERLFYLSGPHTMVVAFEKTLKEMGVPRRQIKTDYFPGFA